MAVVYTMETVTGDILIDFTNQEINVSDDYDQISIQEIIDAIREAEASAIGFVFAAICEASGKDELDADTGVSIGITVKLLDDWKVYSEKTSGVFKIYGGNLIRDDGGDVFKANTLITYVSIQSAASTIVSISSGSGLSTEEHNRLFALPTDTLTTEQDERLEAIETASGEQLTEERFKDLTFERDNTIEGSGAEKRITQYTAGDVAIDPVTVNVVYDEENEYGMPESEEIAS